jgi:hypothetical protein
MKRQEIIQQLFDEFIPFSFKEEEKRALLQDTWEEYVPFLEKLPTVIHCNVHLLIGDRRISSPYEIEITEGVKRFIHNMMEFQNKVYTDYRPLLNHTKDVLEKESQKKVIEFFSTLFNRRLEPILHGYKQNDENYFYYNFHEMNLINDTSIEIIWQDMEEEKIIIDIKD